MEKRAGKPNKASHGSFVGREVLPEGFWGSLRQRDPPGCGRDEGVNEGTIKPGEIPYKTKGIWGSYGKRGDEQRELARWGRAHLDLPGVWIPWIPQQAGWGGDRGMGRAQRRLRPRMPSAREKPSALGNSGMASALPPRNSGTTLCPPEIREQLSPRCAEQREAPQNQDLAGIWGCVVQNQSSGWGFFGTAEGRNRRIPGRVGLESQKEHGQGRPP